MRINRLEELMEEMIRGQRAQVPPAEPAPVAEPVVQPVVQPARIPISLVDFMRVRPPTFSGDSGQENP